MALRNLFNIATEYLEAIDELENYFEENPEAEGEIPEHLHERIYINRNEMEEKLHAYKDVIDMFSADIALLQTRAKELALKQKKAERTIERLKSVMAYAVKQFGTVNEKGNYKFKTKFGSFNYIKTDKLLVEDAAKCPTALKAFDFSLNKMTFTELTAFRKFYENFVAQQDNSNGELWYNKAIFNLEGTILADAVKAKLKAGEVVPGCKLDPEAGHIRSY